MNKRADPGMEEAASEAARPARRRPALRIPKAAELVSRELRKQIVRGELKEGENLAPEAELMERFGVSRPTLREAVRILESEGLISVSRGARGGAIVHRPDVQVATRYVSLVLQSEGTTLSDIYRVHMLIEPAAAGMVAETASRTAPAVLRRCIEDGRLHFEDDFEFGAKSARFRNQLIELAGIPTLSLLMGMLNDIFERYWGSATVSAARRIDNVPAKTRGLKSFEKLVEYIEQGDGAGAEAHWRRHTSLVERAMRNWSPAERVIDLLDH
jgi:GntR family transcriptional repressor for pyruvate dehydrogenase complex